MFIPIYSILKGGHMGPPLRNGDDVCCQKGRHMGLPLRRLTLRSHSFYTIVLPKQKGLIMIKKLTITSLTALSLLLVTAQAEGTKCQASKCGAGMMKQAKQGGMHKAKKMHKMKMNSPFLIKHGLPHMTKMLMKSWDDVKLALNDEQKGKLLLVRKETMGAVMKLKPEVMALKKEIVTASKAGTKAAALKVKVDKLAALESEATMVHLTCLDKTKAILTAEQYSYLMEKRKQHMMKKKEKMKSMKCAAGKCGGK